MPVTTGDEFGELAASFNSMVEGLAERERLREAFGTYLDKEIADYILSEGFTEEGVEIEVTVLFCDVRDFTRFASGATPQEVVEALNRLFEVIVPIIAGQGGHVDKFEGDGLLAVFGAPEPFPDHADRAVRAACEIGTAVNEEGEAGELRVGVGVNTGTVIAGAIGGAGRLNFSVIGGAVNVAARVEAHTRETDDNILITGETWTRLSHAFEVESRGKAELRGVAEPVALYAPKPAEPREPASRTPTRARTGRRRRGRGPGRGAAPPACAAPGGPLVIRLLTALGAACFFGAIALLLADSEDNAVIAIALILASLGISLVLGIRSGYHKARGIVRDAQAFASGDIQHARLVEVGDPKGLINPESTVVLELEGEDGTTHRFERDVPVPFPMAWSYRFGRRFKVPFMTADLNSLMAFELRREGMDVEVGRGREPGRAASPDSVRGSAAVAGSGIRGPTGTRGTPPHGLARYYILNAAITGRWFVALAAPAPAAPRRRRPPPAEVLRANSRAR